jgi:hypothetical protein
VERIRETLLSETGDLLVLDGIFIYIVRARTVPEQNAAKNHKSFCRNVMLDMAECLDRGIRQSIAVNARGDRTIVGDGSPLLSYLPCAGRRPCRARQRQLDLGFQRRNSNAASLTTSPAIAYRST